MTLDFCKFKRTVPNFSKQLTITQLLRSKNGHMFSIIGIPIFLVSKPITEITHLFKNE